MKFTGFFQGYYEIVPSWRDSDFKICVTINDEILYNDLGIDLITEEDESLSTKPN